jgi:Domain of unknown function (DUF932)
MRDAGFLPFRAIQSGTRDTSRSEHTKHMIRFRHADSLPSVAVGDSLVEVVLVNSHDDTNSYKLMAGIYRLVCWNGMVVSESMQGSIGARHSGDVIAEVVNGSLRIAQNAPKILETVQSWKSLQLTSGEQTALAESAHVVRFGNAEGKVDTPITPAQLLQSRRRDDNGADLWRTFNRIQEKCRHRRIVRMGTPRQRPPPPYHHPRSKSDRSGRKTQSRPMAPRRAHGRTEIGLGPLA